MAIQSSFAHFSLNDCEKDGSLEWNEAVGYDALAAASVDVTGDHLETPKGFNDQLQEISKQRRTFFARYLEKLDGLRIKTWKMSILIRYFKRALAKTSKASTLTYFTTRALATTIQKSADSCSERSEREGKENKVSGHVL